MRFNNRYLMVILLAITSLCIKAQNHHRSIPHPLSITNHDLSTNYKDSLASYKSKLFNDSIPTPVTLSNPQVAPFFLPLTFYKHITEKALSLDMNLSPLDARLLSIYLRHPELVEGTESQLETTGGVLQPKTVTDQPAITVKQAEPEEPDTLPIDVMVLKPNFWNFGGDYYLQFLQNYVSTNWYKGGESNYSMVGAVTLEANYNNKQKVKWNNKLEMKLGFMTSNSDSLHNFKTSDDLLRYTGKLGLQVKKDWYYTFQVVGYTQFMRSYKPNKRPVISDFMSPLNINVSLGIDYTVNWLKNRLTGSLHLAPLAYNFRYVDRLALATNYGLQEGKHTLHDFGSQFTIDLKWKFTDNIGWVTRMYGYTTYKRFEYEWENTFTFQFNKFISTKLFVYPRFDDNRKRDEKLGFWQFKEYVSLGFSYSF